MSYAQQIVDGEICQCCLLPLKGAPLGHPAECHECYPDNDTAILNPNEQAEFNERIRKQEAEYKRELASARFK